MTDWGDWDGPGSNQARVGIDTTELSGYRVRVRWYVEWEYGAYDNQTLNRWGNGPDSDVDFYYGQNGGVMQVATTVLNGYPGNTYSYSASLSGTFNGANPSVSTSITLSADVPDAPHNVRITDRTTSSVEFRWSRPSGNGLPILDYRTSFDGDWYTSQDRFGTMGGYAPNTSHFVNVQARNAAGYGPWAGRIYYTTRIAQPDRPSRPRRGSVTSTSWRIYWDQTGNGGSSLEGYRLQVSRNSSFTDLIYNSVTRPYSESHLMDDPQIEPATTYYVRVRVFNSVYNSEYSLADVVTTDVGEPSAPRNLAVSNLTPSGADVNWDAPASNGGSSIESYQFSLDGQFTDVTSTSRTLDGLDPNTVHFVNVRAHNGTEYGPWHGRVYFRLLPGVWVGTSSGWRPAIMHVGDGSSWRQAVARVGRGGRWSQ